MKVNIKIELVIDKKLIKINCFCFHQLNYVVLPKSSHSRYYYYIYVLTPRKNNTVRPLTLIIIYRYC